MKNQPDLNKLKFIKLHRKKRIIRVSKGNKGKTLSSYNFGVALKESKLVTFPQLEAMRKFIIRKLKNKENKNQKNLKIIKSQAKQKKKKTKKKLKEKLMIIRSNFNLGLTKKPLQVRMGKGKGAPVDWVYPCSNDRILLEFSLKRLKEKKIRRTLIAASAKLSSRIKFPRINYSNKVKSFISFNRIGSELVTIKCAKEL